MALWKTAVPEMLIFWKYHSLALSHRYMTMINERRQGAFAVAGSTGACHKNNFRRNQWRQNGNVTTRSFQWTYNEHSFPHQKYRSLALSHRHTALKIAGRYGANFVCTGYITDGKVGIMPTLSSQWIYEDLCARSRYQGQGQAITSHSICGM